MEQSKIGTPDAKIQSRVICPLRRCRREEEKVVSGLKFAGVRMPRFRVSPGTTPRRRASPLKEPEVSITLHQHDLPDGLDLGPVVAVDCETMGLNPHRDRLCLVQLSSGDGTAHLVQIAKGQKKAPNLARMLRARAVEKLFHFGRFDIAVLAHTFGAVARPVYCTKIASKLTRTFTDRHGLRNLCQDLIGVDISKQQQSSDWGAETLTEAQLEYAASDVLYLHRLREVLGERLDREDRTAIAKACFRFLPDRAMLDLMGWSEEDIFAH